MNKKGALVKEKIYGRSELRFPLPSKECPGCGHGIAGKALLEAIEEMGIAGRVIIVIGIGCHFGAVLPIKVDSALQAHGPAPAVATGIKNALFDDAIVITWQGDGDCAAIGAGYLINAAARAQRITVFMLNNTNYGTTGGQAGPTTLLGQVTTTTPSGRDAGTFGYPLHIPEMLATVRGVAYSARGSISSPANFQRTKRYAKTALQKQIDHTGFSFVEILSCCPVNWHMQPVDAIQWIEDKMTVEYPLGEFKNVALID
jgi:2-oxoglutarate ferredoxin oxidoreductase subunit beta